MPILSKSRIVNAKEYQKLNSSSFIKQKGKKKKKLDRKLKVDMASYRKKRMKGIIYSIYIYFIYKLQFARCVCVCVWMA